MDQGNQELAAEANGDRCGNCGLAIQDRNCALSTVFAPAANRVTTFEDVEDSIGDVFLHAVKQVRYLNGKQTDTNVNRQRLHPIWSAATKHLETSLFDFRAGLLSGQYKEIERRMAIDNYTRQITGNAAGLHECPLDVSAVTIRGLPVSEKIQERFPCGMKTEGNVSGCVAES